MNKNNIQIKLMIRKVGYIAWFFLLVIATHCVCSMGLGTNINGESCDYNLWKLGDIYQWVWSGRPCRFTTEYYLSYFLIFVVYFIFDYIRKIILGFNPSLILRIGEIIIWLVVNWIYLLWLTAKDYGVMNMLMVRTSFLGTLLFMLPLVVLAVIARFVSSKITLIVTVGITIIMIAVFMLTF